MIYIIDVLLILAFYKMGGTTKKGKSTALLLSFLIMGLTVVLRGPVGTDYNNYNAIYENVIRSPFSNWYSSASAEVGYVLVCYLCDWLFPGNAWWTHFFMGALTFLFYYLSIKKLSTNYFMTTYLFISMGFMYRIMNQERQELAIAIVMYGVCSLCDGLKLKFIFWVIIASTFHASAWITLLLLIPELINTFKQRKILIIIFSAALLYTVLNIKDILSILGLTRYLWYFGSRFDGSFQATAVIHTIARVGVVIAIYILKKVVIKCHPKYNTIYFMALLLLLTQIGTLFSTTLMRVISYFYVSLIYLLTATLQCIRERTDKKNSQVWGGLATIGATLYHIVYFVVASDSVGMYPYHFFWQ